MMVVDIHNMVVGCDDVRSLGRRVFRLLCGMLVNVIGDSKTLSCYLCGVRYDLVFRYNGVEDAPENIFSLVRWVDQDKGIKLLGINSDYDVFLYDRRLEAGYLKGKYVGDVIQKIYGLLVLVQVIVNMYELVNGHVCNQLVSRRDYDAVLRFRFEYALRGGACYKF